MASKSTSGLSLSNTDDCGSSSGAFQRKRPAEGSSGKAKAVPKVDHDFEDLAKVTPSSNAAVNGVLLDLSPMKRSKNDGPYFEGHIVDNSKRQLRFVGFSASQHASISALKTEEEPVAILGCQVKQTASKDMEILMSNSAVVEHSPRKFDSQQCIQAEAECSPLEMLQQAFLFQRFTTKAKVVRIHDAIQVAGGKLKQEIVIADSSATATLTLWETDVGAVKLDGTYCFSNLVVKTFQGKKELSAPQDATITTAEDISDVAEEADSAHDDDPTHHMDNIEVIGVPVFSSYTSCITCKSKVDAKTSKIGYCTKCSLPQRLDKCKKQLSAKLIYSSKYSRMQHRKDCTHLAHNWQK